MVAGGHRTADDGDNDDDDDALISIGFRRFVVQRRRGVFLARRYVTLSYDERSVCRRTLYIDGSKYVRN